MLYLDATDKHINGDPIGSAAKSQQEQVFLFHRVGFTTPDVRSVTKTLRAPHHKLGFPLKRETTQ